MKLSDYTPEDIEEFAKIMFYAYYEEVGVERGWPSSNWEDISEDSKDWYRNRVLRDI